MIRFDAVVYLLLNVNKGYSIFSESLWNKAQSKLSQNFSVFVTTSNRFKRPEHYWAIDKDKEHLINLLTFCS